MIVLSGTLEVDGRGVIYFHTEEGKTFLRICSLPKEKIKKLTKDSLIDITHMVGMSVFKRWIK